MKVGDLVKHKRTGACGILIRVPEGQPDITFDVQWFDENSSVGEYNSHFIGELVVLNASR